MIKENILLVFKEIGYKKISLFGLLNIAVLILELLSFSMFVPFLMALTNSEKLFSNEHFVNFLALFDIDKNDTTNILFLLFSILIIVFFIKNLFIGFSKYVQYKISADIEINLTSIVFKKYLRKPYLFHTLQNSSKAVRDVIAEAGMFSRALLNSILSIIIETIVLVGIFIILYLNQPEISLKLITFFFFLGLFFFIIFKNKFYLLGKERQIQDKQRIKYVQQGIQGIKEIIAFNLQDFFLRLFNKSNEKVLTSIHFANYINQIPKLFLEFLAILVILIIFYTTEEIHDDINKQIFVFGLIAAAAFRLFPAINKILLSMNTFQYSKPSLYVLSEIFKDDLNNSKTQINEGNNKRLDFNNFIEIKNLSFKYSTSKDDIIKNLSIKINKGDHIGIMGATGSGKSTLVDLILGIITPNQGDIFCDNDSIFKSPKEWRKLIGYVSQFPYLLDGSVIENVAVGIDKKNISKERAIKSLEIANLKNFIMGLNDGLNSQVGERGVQLSGGQIQRLAIARALYNSPKILILDEATASVDVKTQENIMQDLNEFKKEITMISISHDKDALIHCNKIYQLKESKLITNN